MQSLQSRHEEESLLFFAHELKGPAITVMAGVTELRRCLRRSAGPQADEVLQIVEEAALSLIEEIDQLGNLCLDPERFEPEPVLLQHLLPNAVEHFRREHRRRVQLEVPYDLPVAAGHAFSIETVVSNLLKNAEKYSPSLAPIELKAHPDGNAVLISVRDYGSGVPAEELETIFQLFYRSRKDSSAAGGKGIGLYLCRRLVTMMGGSIWAEQQAPGLLLNFSLLAYDAVAAPMHSK